MRVFVGWVPTVTGRLSFSRIGDAHTGDRTVCNNTATLNGDGFLFGSETRTSRDGPFPAAVMRRIGRVPDVLYITRLKVAAADLPVQAPKAQTDDPCSAPVTLEHDQEGALEGEVMFFSWGKALPKSLRSKVSKLKALASEGRAPGCSQVDRLNKYKSFHSLSDEIWADLTNRFAAGEKLPGFGKIQVRLLRTGQCEITVRRDSLYTTRSMKSAHKVSIKTGRLVVDDDAMSLASASAARQSFFFIRDLAHRHYHHHPDSDLLTTTYSWSIDDDEHWRRETQYGLVRLAISERRRDTAETFKRSLGIIAYAEAFQRHLCGWISQSHSQPIRSPLGFAYDFSALRSSIDASLKVRELRDTQRRQTLIFVFGFVITCLGILITSIRIIDPPPETASEFRNFLKLMVSHPLLSLFVAAILAWAIDLTFMGISLRPRILGGWPGGLGRAVEAVMGSLMWRKVDRAAAFTAGLTMLVVITLSAAWVAFTAYREAFQWLTN